VLFALLENDNSMHIQLTFFWQHYYPLLLSPQAYALLKMCVHWEQVRDRTLVDT